MSATKRELEEYSDEDEDENSQTEDRSHTNPTEPTKKKHRQLITSESEGASSDSNYEVSQPEKRRNSATTANKKNQQKTKEPNDENLIDSLRDLVSSKNLNALSFNDVYHSLEEQYSTNLSRKRKFLKSAVLSLIVDSDDSQDEASDNSQGEATAEANEENDKKPLRNVEINRSRRIFVIRPQEVPDHSKVPLFDEQNELKSKTIFEISYIKLEEKKNAYRYK